MQLHVIHSGFFKLDGGALYGVVPKVLWQNNTPADENNLCDVATRCLLIEDKDRLILIDTGIGDKQDEKFLKNYHLHGDYSLLKSIYKAGFKAEDITDVFHTHLHFDHCGGSVKYKDREKKETALVFPNAKYWSNEGHWKWATEPNAREKASFLKENILPMKESGHLHFVDQEKGSPFEQFDLIYIDGHTDKQMLPVIRYKDKTIVFIADLIPFASHIRIPWVASFDTRPLLTLKEKADFLNTAADQQFVIFFEHDPAVECATVKHTDNGVRLDETFKLEDIL